MTLLTICRDFSEPEEGGTKVHWGESKLRNWTMGREAVIRFPARNAIRSYDAVKNGDNNKRIGLKCEFIFTDDPLIKSVTFD